MDQGIRLWQRGNTPEDIVSKRIIVTEQTYYRWRNEYGGMKVSQAKRLKELERENAQLKIADITLDKQTLKEGLGILLSPDRRRKRVDPVCMKLDISDEGLAVYWASPIPPSVTNPQEERMNRD